MPAFIIPQDQELLGDIRIGLFIKDLSRSHEIQPNASWLTEACTVLHTTAFRGGAQSSSLQRGERSALWSMILPCLWSQSDAGWIKQQANYVGWKQKVFTFEKAPPIYILMFQNSNAFLWWCNLKAGQSSQTAGFKSLRAYWKSGNLYLVQTWG